ncbi:hypothetical protein QCD71_19910 [Sphingomonas sp. PsM26]|nr:hypothetical protein [Sphingomonas sp. PsM26]
MNVRAALITDASELISGLHSFGSNRHAEIGAKTRYGAQDCLAIGISARDKGTVNLDLVKRELLEVAQRRVSGAEVVH